MVLTPDEAYLRIDWTKLFPSAPGFGTKFELERGTTNKHLIAWYDNYRASIRIGIGSKIPLTGGNFHDVVDIKEARNIFKGAIKEFHWSIVKELSKSASATSGVVGKIETIEVEKVIEKEVLIEVEKEVLIIPPKPVHPNSLKELEELFLHRVGTWDDEAQKHIPEDFTFYDQELKMEGDKVGETLVECLIDCMRYDETALLEGLTGCGKSTAIEWLCAKAKVPYYRLQMKGGSTEDDVLGRDRIKVEIINDNGVPTQVWVDGKFIKAMREGGVVCFDEVNACEHAVRMAVRSVLDDYKAVTLIEKDGETIKAHEDFRVFATQNPAEMGMHGGTQPLSEADLDRFDHVLWVDYLEEEVEVHCVMEKSGNYNQPMVGDMVKWANLVRGSFVGMEGRKRGVISCVSTRRLIKWAVKALRASVKAAFCSTGYRKLRPQDRAAVMETFEGIFKEDKTYEINVKQDDPTDENN
jgi:MoxR-like ATPase